MDPQTILSVLREVEAEIQDKIRNSPDPTYKFIWALLYGSAVQMQKSTEEALTLFTLDTSVVGGPDTLS